MIAHKAKTMVGLSLHIQFLKLDFHRTMDLAHFFCKFSLLAQVFGKVVQRVKKLGYTSSSDPNTQTCEHTHTLSVHTNWSIIVTICIYLTSC